MNYRGEVITHEATATGDFFINLVVTCVNAADITDAANFGLALEDEVALSRAGVSNSTAKPKVDYLTLSKKWSIYPEIAKKTLRVTTQRDIRTVFHSSLYKIFRTND